MENVFGVTVHVHPVALMAIVDSHERRAEGSKRAVGTLVGVKEKRGVVVIRNAYPVPHNETEELVEIGMDFNDGMMKLHQRVHPNEVTVGWYSSSSDITMHSLLIHEYYARLDSNALFLTLDTSLKENSLRIRAHIKSRMGLPGKSEGVVFSPVPCEVVCYEPERVGVAFLREAVEKPNPIKKDLQQVCQAADSLDQLLEQALSYVEKVLAGDVTGNPTAGRKLMEAVSCIPQMDEATFESILNSTMQDHLMVVYLFNLVKTQLVLGEKLCQITS
jgi:translation initiation factor 3 subunit F